MNNNFKKLSTGFLGFCVLLSTVCCGKANGENNITKDNGVPTQNASISESNTKEDSQLSTSLNNDSGTPSQAQMPLNGNETESSNRENVASGMSEISKDIPLGVQALLKAYPDFIKGYENGYIIYSDGSKQIYDDGKEKDFDTLLDNSSLKDMFYVAYEQPNGSPKYLMDAGRSRNEDFFKKMYGNSAAAVRKNLVTVNWLGQNVTFTNINGAADQLKKVAAELAKRPDLKKYLKSSGTFYWRKVRGANRQSAHSYGIAFDIGVDNSDYWLWKNPKAKETDKIKYANRMPKDIVDIFEKYGFIWGGSWYHFDTMHFEYRPEILYYSQLYKENEGK